MTSSANIIHAHILASTFSWNFDLNKWKIRVFIGLTILHRAACSLAYAHAASKGEVHMHEHEQQLTNTCIRCNMYKPAPPSDSSMHSHLRRFACRPTPIDLSSKLSLKFKLKVILFG